MWQLLIGGSIGAAGIILALWWRFRMATLENKITGYQRDIVSLNRDKNELNVQLAASVQQLADTIDGHKKELVRSMSKLNVHEQREEHYRALLKKHVSPDTVTERVGLLFPMPETPGSGDEDGGSGED